jgi:hypothetical protein
MWTCQESLGDRIAMGAIHDDLCRIISFQHACFNVQTPGKIQVFFDGFALLLRLAGKIGLGGGRYTAKQSALRKSATLRPRRINIAAGLPLRRRPAAPARAAATA